MLPVAAADDAVRVTFCETPGMRDRVEGLAVTPAGSPAMATETAPVKEFSAVALTCIEEPVEPATRLRDVGVMESEKSGGGGAAATVSATLAVWVSDPEIPVRVMALLPATAVDAAVRVTFCKAPGVRVKAAGLAVTPAGSPVTVTETVPVKEFRAVALTCTAEPVAPAVKDSDVGATESEKSGGGGAAETVREALAAWLSVPEIPVNVMTLLPVAAVDAAVRVMFCEMPGVSDRVAGLAVTPVGNPLMATDTFPVKEFTAVARTLT